MKQTKLLYNLILGFLLLVSCQPHVSVVSHSDAVPRLTPDYAGVTVPCNIAPLSFTVDGLTEAALIIKGEKDSICMTTDDGEFDIPEGEWRNLLADNLGKRLSLIVCRPVKDGWEAMKTQYITVSADSIDPYIVYRRIQPGYGLWNVMGLYSRSMADYTEECIYDNRQGNGNCINCHAFNQGNPDEWQVHMRFRKAGTYITRNGKTTMLDVHYSDLPEGTKPPKPVYPAWHPSGRYIAYSTNNTFFYIHTRDKNRWEVMDSESDVMVVDTETGEALRPAQTASKERYETFPCFSPDGRWLYFCSAQPVDSITTQYDRIRYSICRVEFSEGRFGTKVDTVFNAEREKASAYMPKISPDGRWLSYVRSPYGQFGVCHRDADLWLIDLHTLTETPLKASNSPYSDSWHSWSSNSRWIAFASKRSDGIYTRLYFTHIDSHGHASKAFVLPQRHAARYYETLMDAYNIPEMVKDRPTPLAP